MKREQKFWKRTDLRIRRFCRNLTNRQRTVGVATAFILFALSCLYMVFCSIADFGYSGDGPEIEHIRLLELEKPGKQTDYEKNHFKDHYDYGHSENQDTARVES